MPQRSQCLREVNASKKNGPISMGLRPIEAPPRASRPPFAFLPQLRVGCVVGPKQQTFHILGQNVRLDVDLAAEIQFSQRCYL